MFSRFLASRGVRKVLRPSEDTLDDNDADGFYRHRRDSFNQPQVPNVSPPPLPPPVLFDYVETAARPLPSDAMTVRIRNNYRHYSIHGATAPMHDNAISLSSLSVWSLLSSQPAASYSDGLGLKFEGNVTLGDHLYCRRYKNNLAEVVTVNSEPFLVTAVNSEILMFELDISHLPCPEPVQKFDTKPAITYTSDRLVSTWPYFPHTINYLKVAVFLNRPVLVVCVDDGYILIYFTANLLGRPVPDFRLKLESSVWGVDIQDDVIVASDNSQSLTLFNYYEPTGTFYHIKSHQILHNIPAVLIVSTTPTSVTAAAVSISSELVVFRFAFQVVQGPEILQPHLQPDLQPEPYYVDPLMAPDRAAPGPRFERYVYRAPSVVARSLLKEDNWTVHVVSPKYFKSVHSLNELVGSGTADEEMDRIVNEARLFGMVEENTVDLSPIAPFQYFKVPVVPLGNTDYEKLASVDDEYRRMDKMFHEPAATDPVLFVTTSKKAALFHSNLKCICSTPTLSNLEMPAADEVRYSNRLSISHVVPELAVAVVVNQQGLLHVFRLTEHRGLLGMRQEHVFPNIFRLTLGGHEGYRSIIGVGVRDVSVVGGALVVYVVYSDGLVMVHRVESSSEL